MLGQQWKLLVVGVGAVALAGCLSDGDSGSSSNNSAADQSDLTAAGGPGNAPGSAGNGQGNGASQSAGPPMVPPGIDRQMGIEVLSSAPDQVSGGDVRIAVEGPPGQLKRVSLWLNDQNLGLAGLEGEGRRLEGLLEGLQEGENVLQLQHERFGKLDEVVLENHPISGPMFSGEQQTPFVCMTHREFGIEPQVDSASPPGFQVLDDDGQVIGYSRNCHIEPFITYHYRTTDGGWADWPDDDTFPDDLATTTTIDGKEKDFVVRVERGTINRFLFSYAMLIDPDRIGADTQDTSHWNGRLLYHFQGGVGIGHTQGRWDNSRAMNPEVLGLGHAIAYSTGTRTGEHYNLQVGGETALMTKEHFIKRFGEPLYTVGLGGSGGAIQQYVYGQNHPGLIDIAVPQRSYPDMVTQTIHIGDCELLEHYMDVTDGDNPKWQTTENRSWLVGLNATDFVDDPLADTKPQLGFGTAPGSSECIAAWRGLSPLTLNPHFGSARESDRWEPQSEIAEIEWTHPDDLRNIYGVGDDGFARRAVDNVGVQYGLGAFVEGQLTTAEFLDLNAQVGGWKPSAEMVQEGFPFLGDPTPENFDPWSRRNMMLSDTDAPAPRHEGDPEAIRALYDTGMVFQGHIDIPVIDIREWMEPILDMHNSHQSFAARARILEAMPDDDHHLVWFADIGDEADGYPGKQFGMTMKALRLADEWMLAILDDPKERVAANRPAAAVDRCFTQDGETIAAGDDVWAGILDERAPGACTLEFPVYTTSRIEAGGPISGDVFKCQRKSVDTALTDGTYGSRTFTADQQERLREIFPEGVCDYALPDAGRPAVSSNW